MFHMKLSKIAVRQNAIFQWITESMLHQLTVITNELLNKPLLNDNPAEPIKYHVENIERFLISQIN